MAFQSSFPRGLLIIQRLLCMPWHYNGWQSLLIHYPTWPYTKTCLAYTKYTPNSPDRNGSCSQVLFSDFTKLYANIHNFTLDIGCEAYLIQAQMLTIKQLSNNGGQQWLLRDICKIFGGTMVTVMLW